ncbi:hypothetical protein BGX24_010183 [Mortierella sp. AD032]|nr:hypothetical protein BGX24_010183 [Mortierella sp. AD032]
MDSPTWDTPNSIASQNNDGSNSSGLLTRLFKNEHSGAIQSLSEGKGVEHDSQEDDHLVASSSPIAEQPNASTTKLSNNEGVQDNDVLYQATIEAANQGSLANTNATVAVDSSTTNTKTNANSDKKPTPKRAMILSGRPTPPLPPRPVFPADLENYQLQSGTVSNQHMKSYLTRVRQDFDHQTQLYEVLKEVLLQDTHHMTAVVDELDAMDEDPFTLDSFENLMRMHASRGKDFIIARVTTQDPSDENKHYHSYYGAHQINKVLFRTQPDEGLLHRMKARNPLNNMLVVGDVHYYIISAADVKAVRPLPTVRSSSASISSHSSRMSRCSKLAAQAIASQSASARSSPILGSDMSLFSRSSESPVSIISPLMALSILKADQEDPLHHQRDLNGGGVGTDSGVVQPLNPRRRGSQGMASSTTNSSTTSTPTSAQGTFHQPGRPSRLRQAIETEDQDLASSSLAMVGEMNSAATGAHSSLAESDVRDGSFSPMTPPIRHHQQQQNSQTSPSSSAAGQSPLFQSLMGGRIRGRSSTVSSVASDRSSTSTMSTRSHQSHASKCSTATNDSDSTSSSSSSNNECYSPALSSDSTTSINLTRDKEDASSASSNTSSNKNSGDGDNVIYKFRYLASDDDFLLRSTVRQTFKVNAFESWDAILFTISNNALREYSNQGGEQVLQPLGGHLHHNNNHPQSLSLLPSSPSPVSAQVPPQQQHQQMQESVTTLTTAAAAAVAAQYSAQNHSQAQTTAPAPLTVRVQDIAPPNRSASEPHHYHLTDSSFTSNNSSNSTNISFDTEDSTTTTTTPFSPLYRRSRGGLYSAGVNGGPRGFDIHSFSHSSHRHDQGQEDRQQQGGGVEGLNRSRSHNHHLFRSLPALPLGVSSNGACADAGESGGCVDGETMTTESMCVGGGGGNGSVGSGSGSGGGRKKLCRVLSKIFSRK